MAKGIALDLWFWFCISLFVLQPIPTTVFVSAQVSWTPIYVDSNSQVDLWTQVSKGCACPWDSAKKDCACCVKDGGCHCGRDSSNRCTQCGLEQHCSSMCNMTIDSKYLHKKSGKIFGQIKSPSLEGPESCWYTFRADKNQRIELQVYRLVNAGRFNGSSCESGHLQLSEGSERRANGAAIQICGANERYSPPVVMYIDEDEANLIFQINEKTLRSQFLAYFSFTPKDSTQGVGFQPAGGARIPHTECDWLYQDFSCLKARSCILASPGYPGVYPPNRQCKYHITTSSIHTRVRIVFTAVLMPHNHCQTDFIAIYQGSSTSSLQLTTICGNRRTEVEYSGPNLLLEFNSGSQVPPFDYSGFVASLEFVEKSSSTESYITLAAQTDYVSTHNAIDTSVSGTISTDVLPLKPDCNAYISSNISRSGHFDTRKYDWYPNCRIVFRGNPTDVVHVSLFNYRLRAPSCRSVIEIFSGLSEDGVKPMKKICSPETKRSRDGAGQFVEQETFVSASNVMSVLLRRSNAPASENDVEFLDGAFLFHDEQIGGTLQPFTMCDVKYYGMSSPSIGTIDNPVGKHLFWNVNGPLKCVQQFIPATNQSITITIRTLEQMSSKSHCQTHCGDNGCRCVSETLPLSKLDHLLLVTDYDQHVTCLCGDFQAEWLPVKVRSWSPLYIMYSVAQYGWNSESYKFTAEYAFINDAECGHHTYTTLMGEINSKNISNSGQLNNYFYQSCTWILDSNVQRQLFIELSSAQSRPCTAWNFTVHEFSSSVNSPLHLGELLYTFCPRDKHKTYSLPWKLNTVVIRLRALTRTKPQFSLKWRSQVVRANTRLGNPTPVPNAVSASCVTLSAVSVNIPVLLVICVASLYIANFIQGTH